MGLRVTFPEGVGETEILQTTQGAARLRLEERISKPRFGIVNIIGRGDDIEITHQSERLFKSEESVGVVGEPVMPRELVGEFVGPQRIAIGRIDGSDADGAAACRNDGLEISRMIVAVPARQPWRDVL